MYIHFLDNNQTLNHRSIIYGIRELNFEEIDQIFNSPSFILNQPAQFSSNYKIRGYQSGCFYLDSNNNWQSNGLLVNYLGFY